MLVDSPGGALAAGGLVCASRAALSLVCRRGVPAARNTGLGVVVAGTVRWPVAAVTWLAVLVGLAVTVRPWWSGGLVGLLAGLAVLGLVRHCVRRFGGVTGDVMGAAVEVAFTVLVVGVVAG